MEKKYADTKQESFRLGIPFRTVKKFKFLPKKVEVSLPEIFDIPPDQLPPIETTQRELKT